jgi:hypothetical protein
MDNGIDGIRYIRVSVSRLIKGNNNIIPYLAYVAHFDVRLQKGRPSSSERWRLVSLVMGCS